MKSAVEHLTRVRQVMSRDYSSVRTIVTTDYEAMYAYRCGEYENCLQLCEENVIKLQSTSILTTVCRAPSTDLLLLLDDECMSLVGITVKRLGRFDNSLANKLSQITVSLYYLLVQSKLQLRHSMTSLASVLRIISITYRRFATEHIVDRLLLAFVYRKAWRSLHHNQVSRKR